MTLWNIKVQCRRIDGRADGPDIMECGYTGSYLGAMMSARRLIIQARNDGSSYGFDEIGAIITKDAALIQTNVLVRRSGSKILFDSIELFPVGHDIENSYIRLYHPSPTQSYFSGGHTYAKKSFVRGRLDNASASFTRKCFRTLRRGIKEMQRTDLPSYAYRTSIANLDIVDLINMSHYPYAVVNGQVHLSKMNMMPMLKSNRSNEKMVIPQVIDVAIKHKSFLESYRGDHDLRKIKTTPEVLEWIAEHAIDWVSHNGVVELLHDEDYTLYKVIFE